MFQIIRVIKYTDKIFLNEIRTAPIAKAALPGQFVMVTVHSDQPPLPLPIADYNGKKGTITIVVEAGDRQRERMMALEKGDSLFDCRGPFGKPSQIDSIQKVVCIGKGTGIAAMFPLLREYKAMDCYTISIIGFQSKNQLFWLDRIAKQSDELYVTTEDGSFGIKGRVTTALRAVIETAKDIDRVVTVAPLKAMKACADITRPLDIPTFINFNAVIPEEMWREGRIRVSGGPQKSFFFMESTEYNGYLLDFETLIAQEKHYAEAEQKTPAENPEAG